jgi:hypothetical protein
MAGPWLYAIAKTSGSTFSFTNGSKPIVATVENFRKLVAVRRLEEDPEWSVRKYVNNVEIGDELFIYSGDDGIGIIGYATIEKIGGRPGKRYVVPKFDYAKTEVLLDHPISAAKVKAWKFFLRPNLVDLSTVAKELQNLLPSGFFRTNLISATARMLTASEVEDAVRTNRLAVPIVPTDDKIREARAIFEMWSVSAGCTTHFSGPGIGA